MKTTLTTLPEDMGVRGVFRFLRLCPLPTRSMDQMWVLTVSWYQTE